MTITTQKTTETRLDRIREVAGRVFTRVFTVFNVGLGLLIASVIVGIIGYNQTHDNRFTWRDFWQDYYANISAELGSVAVTVLIIDQLNRRRQKDEEKQRLIRQMGSKENSMTLQAVEELKVMGALKDGSLVGQNFEEANLHGANMGRVNMRHAKMDFSDLREAVLFFADMEYADMSGVKARKTVFTFANLKNANLVAADLRGALMMGADLTFAKLDQAAFDENTQLPDKTNWFKGIDLTRFTDPEHAQYWRADMPESPAYDPRYRQS